MEKLCDRQIPWPVFACPLCLGISVASAIHSRASFWYGSSADLSRTERVANALVQVWYDHGQQMPKGEVGLGAIASQITSQWNAAGLDP